MSIGKSALEDERTTSQRGAVDASSVEFSDDDTVILPKGSLDPVYEAKARVLNRAVSFATFCPLVHLVPIAQ